MKNIKLCLRVTLALFLLAGCGVFITQSSSAYMGDDCITQRFNAFLNANSLYSRAFNQVHHGSPVNCNPQQNYPHCSNVCSSNPSDPACVSCRNACDAGTNESIFGFAQGYLGGIASQFCTFEPDYCGNARSQHDMCVAIRNNRWENPVYDPSQKGNVPDNEWFSDVTEEYMMCREASGVDNCE